MDPHDGISIVVPLHNEEGNVLAVAKELQRTMEQLEYPWELILVDDGSTDETFGHMQELLSHWPESKLKALRIERRCGQSQALWEGLMRASHGCILTLDGDGQYVAEDIFKFLTVCHNADVVSGVRSRRNDQLTKRWFSYAANAIRRMLTGSQLADSGCAFRMFAREQLKVCQPMHGFHRFILTMFENANLRIASVEVQHHQRRSGLSKYTNFSRTLVPLLDLLAIQWLNRRRFQPANVLAYRSSDFNQLISCQEPNVQWHDQHDSPAFCDYSSRAFVHDELATTSTRS